MRNLSCLSRREGWGFPSTGANETLISCLWDGQWSNDVNIETCISQYHSVSLLISIRVSSFQSFHARTLHLRVSLARAPRGTTGLRSRPTGVPMDTSGAPEPGPTWRTSVSTRDGSTAPPFRPAGVSAVQCRFSSQL